MARTDETVNSLREALELSPENVPLRRQLAELLLLADRFAEAEKEFRLALAHAPSDSFLKVGLARAFFLQGKQSQTLVVIEDLLKQAQTPAAAYLLHAHLLLRQGEVDRAAHQYREAIEFDPFLTDEHLAAALGVDTVPPPDEMPDLGHQPPSRRRNEPPEQLHAPVEKPSISLADVGGMEKIKDEIRLKIIHPLTHSHLYAAYGKAIGGGIILLGPPGCGKTYLARATAGEVKAAFLTVGINEVLAMGSGQSEKNLHGFFQQARTNRPCVLFIDEADALGANPSNMRSSGQRPLINQLLAELDGVAVSNQGMLVLAATNAPWNLDPALLRPGRLDRILFVPPPDEAARIVILRLHCRNKSLNLVDFQKIGRKTEGFSRADLMALVDGAEEKKLRQGLRDSVPRPLTTRDLLMALDSVKASTQEWFAMARNYALHSNQDGMYDDVLKYLHL
jgi:transitional endoplasmic reticulum ATPase